MKHVSVVVAVVGLLLLGAAAEHEPAAREPAPAPAPADDAAPTGMISFFAGAACPEGWQPIALAQGRVLIGTSDVDTIGRVVGTPLTAAEDRAHGHAITAAIDLPARSIAAADGGNNQGAASGARPLAGDATAATSGLPFAQLTTCVSP